MPRARKKIAEHSTFEEAGSIGQDQKPEEHPFENKTLRPFTGRLASGRGRVIEADDAHWSIDATDNPLTTREADLCIRNGFDVLNDDGTPITALAGEKRIVREHGDINWVARTLVGENAGRGR